MEIPTRTTLAIALAGAVAAGVSGCGTTKHVNALRPPSALLVSAAITPERISVSPARLGGGPITLVITNLTSGSQQATFESAGAPGSAAKPGIRQQTGPINPNGTATLKANLVPGRYRVRVGGDAIPPAPVVVAGTRPSSQNDLMLP